MKEINVIFDYFQQMRMWLLEKKYILTNLVFRKVETYLYIAFTWWQTCSIAKPIMFFPRAINTPFEFSYR